MLKNRLTTARLGWDPRFHNPHLVKWLHRIKVPTLILWGDSDQVFPPQQAAAFKELIPHAQVKIIEHCGHVPQVEKTDVFVEAFVAFVGGVKS
jgi:pimeloyl-ACP methyl ester carboxylesterase